MVMEGPPEINPPSGRVPGQELLLIPISGSRWRRNNGENVEKESSPRVFGMKGINRGETGHQGWPHLARRPGGAPGGRLARGWLPPAPPSGIWKLPTNKNFCNFLAILIFHLFLQCTDNNRQKLALGTRLIG